MAMFVCARADGVMDELRRAANARPDLVDPPRVVAFLNSLKMGWLISYDLAIPKRRGKDKKPIPVMVNSRMAGKFAHYLRTALRHPFCQHAPLFADNGGFQIQQGRIAGPSIPDLASFYYRTIQWSSAWSFTLDVAPGSGYHIGEEEMLRLSLDSYGKALRLPQAALDKMHCVLHFRTPALLRTTMTLIEQGYTDPYTSFATGGIASFKGSLKSSVIAPVVPLVRVLELAMERRIGRVRFHVFGAAQPVDFFEYRVIEEFVKRRLHVDLAITADSTQVYSYFARSYKAVSFDLMEHRARSLSISGKQSTAEVRRSREAYAGLVRDHLNGIVLPQGVALDVRDLFHDGGSRGLTNAGLLYGLMLYLEVYRRAADVYEQEIAEGVALIDHKKDFIEWAAGWIFRLRITGARKTGSPQPGNNDLNRALRLRTSCLHIEQMCPGYTEEIFLQAVGE